MVGQRARITDLTGKRVLILAAGMLPVGIWRVSDKKGVEEEYYVPTVPKDWRWHALSLLKSKGSDPSWTEWVNQLVNDSSGYWTIFVVYDAPDDEPLEATLHRFHDETFAESIKK